MNYFGDRLTTSRKISVAYSSLSRAVDCMHCAIGIEQKLEEDIQKKGNCIATYLKNVHRHFVNFTELAWTN